MREPTKLRLWVAGCLVFALGMAASDFGVRLASASPAGSAEQLMLGQTVNTPLTQEVLFTTSSSCVTSLTGRHGIELYNNGPGTIYCSLTTAAVLNKGRPISPGSWWAVDAIDKTPVCCIASAPQATGAATIATQTR